MIKKIIFLSILALIFSFTTVGLAQNPGFSSLTAEKLEDFKKEPPLSQSDIDAFIKIMPAMAKYKGKDFSAITPEERKTIEETVSKVGLSDVRSILIFNKISLGMLALGGTPVEMFGDMEIPEPLIPTESDVELLKKNQSALDKLFMQYGG